MASGRLGTADLVAGVWTVIYTVPVGKIATLNINLFNRGTNFVEVNLAISDDSAPIPPDADIIDGVVNFAAKGVLQRIGHVASENEKIMAYASVATISASVEGFEK